MMDVGGLFFDFEPFRRDRGRREHERVVPNAGGRARADQTGAEEVEDLKAVQPEHLEAVKAKLKPLQIPKFEGKLAALKGGGEGRWGRAV